MQTGSGCVFSLASLGPLSCVLRVKLNVACLPAVNLKECGINLQLQLLVIWLLQHEENVSGCTRRHTIKADFSWIQATGSEDTAEGKLTRQSVDAFGTILVLS